MAPPKRKPKASPPPPSASSPIHLPGVALGLFAAIAAGFAASRALRKRPQQQVPPQEIDSLPPTLLPPVDFEPQPPRDQDGSIPKLLPQDGDVRIENQLPAHTAVLSVVAEAVVDPSVHELAQKQVREEEKETIPMQTEKSVLVGDVIQAEEPSQKLPGEVKMAQQPHVQTEQNVVNDSGNADPNGSVHVNGFIVTALECSPEDDGRDRNDMAGVHGEILGRKNDRIELLQGNSIQEMLLANTITSGIPGEGKKDEAAVMEGTADLQNLSKSVASSLEEEKRESGLANESTSLAIHGNAIANPEMDSEEDHKGLSNGSNVSDESLDSEHSSQEVTSAAVKPVDTAADELAASAEMKPMEEDEVSAEILVKKEAKANSGDEGVLNSTGILPHESSEPPASEPTMDAFGASSSESPASELTTIGENSFPLAREFAAASISSIEMHHTEQPSTAQDVPEDDPPALISVGKFEQIGASYTKHLEERSVDRDLKLQSGEELDRLSSSDGSEPVQMSLNSSCEMNALAAADVVDLGSKDGGSMPCSSEIGIESHTVEGEKQHPKSQPIKKLAGLKLDLSDTLQYNSEIVPEPSQRPEHGRSLLSVECYYQNCQNRNIKLADYLPIEMVLIGMLIGLVSLILWYLGYPTVRQTKVVD